MFFLKLSLLLFFIISTNSGFLERIGNIGINFGLFIFLSIWLMVTIIFFSVAFYSGRNTRFFWGIIFAVSAFSGSVFYSSSGGEFFSYIGLASLWDAKANIGDAYNLYFNIMFTTFLMALTGFIGIILPYKTQTTNKKWVAILPILPMTLIFLILYYKAGEGTNGLPTQVTPITIFSFFLSDKALANDTPQREKISVQPVNKPMINNIVMIVDESVRADFLDINNKQQGIKTVLNDNRNIINFGWSSSSSNCSLYSNLALIYGGNNKHLLDIILTKPSIWEYAKNAGYDTYFIEGQYLVKKDKEWMEFDNIDHFIDIYSRMDEEEKVYIDLEIAKQLKHIINTNKNKKFIYVVKSGAHFPYEKNYPEDKALYHPYMSKGSIFSPRNTVSEDPELVVNSYKNVVSWNTNSFFKELFSEKLTNPALFIYTSDHGQKLKSERGGSFFTHCNTTFISPFEGLVPLLITTNDAKLKNIFDRAAEVNFNNTTHFNIFPTILWLLGYDRNYAIEHYDELLTTQLNSKQEFVSPPFFTRFGKQQKWNPIPKNSD